MPFIRAGQLARESSFARPDDSLGLVAENLRSGHYGTIPVFDTTNIDPRALRHENLLGLVDERDLSRVLQPVAVAQRTAVTVPHDIDFFGAGERQLERWLGT